MTPSHGGESHAGLHGAEPVGRLSGDRWGGALVAVERGDFPISPTGFRSLSGAGIARVTPDFLESLAQAHERERQAVLRRLREVQEPVGDPIYKLFDAPPVATTPK